MTNKPTMTEQKTKGGPGDGDIYIGSMIRLARLQSGMSQGSLGAALGLTFQQIQKYERGANRVSAMHLHKISGILSKPIIYFLPEISDRGKPAMGEVGCGVGYVLTASDWRLINAVRKLPARTRGIIRRLVEDAARMVEEGVGHDRV
jgi:transcriptional regulator with XRE-family HTH domain